MAREFLHVPETPADLGDFARRTRNEGAAPGVRRTAVHLQRGIQPMEPQAHGRRRQPRIVKIFELAFLLEVTPLPSPALRLVFRPTLTHTQRQ